MLKKRRQLRQTLNQFYEKPVAKVSINVFLTLGAILFFAFFAIKPTLVTMSDLVKEIEDKKALSKKMDSKITALASAQVAYQNVENRLAVVDQAIPSSPNLVEALKIIEKIASDKQLVISNLTVEEIPEQPKKELDFSKLKRLNLEIKVTLLGDYLAIKEFIEELQNSRRNMIIDRVAFSVDTDRGSKVLSASVLLSSSYYGQGK
ncbi:MAG: type 4a pilus biogenesis protein PilO [Candidatus Woesebacteria bacterium]|jgi:Tfp pilus assembly protein PilO